jgi:hypothetical protein
VHRLIIAPTRRGLSGRTFGSGTAPFAIGLIISKGKITEYEVIADGARLHRLDLAFR